MTRLLTFEPEKLHTMSLNDNTMFINKLTPVISGLRYTVGNTNWTQVKGAIILHDVSLRWNPRAYPHTLYISSK